MIALRPAEWTAEAAAHLLGAMASPAGLDDARERVEAGRAALFTVEDDGAAVGALLASVVDDAAGRDLLGEAVAASGTRGLLGRLWGPMRALADAAGLDGVRVQVTEPRLWPVYRRMGFQTVVAYMRRPV